jgi:hypothetical protein
MKTTILSFTLSISLLTCFAQFPSPTNFEFSYDYIMIDESGYCNGQYVGGPTYCSYFSWFVPDTNSNTAHLEYYKIYYYDYNSQQTSVLASITDTTFEYEIGILGEVWVTAYYSNPEGESDSSNIVINNDLPLSDSENPYLVLKPIIYDRVSGRILYKNIEKFEVIHIYNSMGELIQTIIPQSEIIEFSDYKNALYIIEAVTKKGDTIKYKFIK